MGENIEIDRCCRSHDHCNLSVESGETKYGYNNTGLYTVSDCQCDTNLRLCLENLRFWVADLVNGVYAFTNRKCLLNLCTMDFYRCARDESVRISTINETMFHGIEEANDTEAVNLLIINGMENKQKNEQSKSVENERSHAQFNQNPVPYQLQRQNSHYAAVHPTQLQRIDNLNTEVANQRNHPYQSFHFYYQNLPTQRQSDTICCVDEFQQL